MYKDNATFRPNVPIPTLRHLAWLHANRRFPPLSMVRCVDVTNRTAARLAGLVLRGLAARANVLLGQLAALIFHFVTIEAHTSDGRMPQCSVK